jgi:hypothetical protein
VRGERWTGVISSLATLGDNNERAYYLLLKQEKEKKITNYNYNDSNDEDIERFFLVYIRTTTLLLISTEARQAVGFSFH